MRWMLARGLTEKTRVQDRLPGLAPRHDGFHVVGKYFLRHAAEIRERIDESYFSSPLIAQVRGKSNDQREAHHDDDLISL